MIWEAVWSAVAEASIPSSLVPSTDTSRPSKVELVVTAPVKAPPARGRTPKLVRAVAALATSLRLLATSKEPANEAYAATHAVPL